MIVGTVDGKKEGIPGESFVYLFVIFLGYFPNIFVVEDLFRFRLYGSSSDPPLVVEHPILCISTRYLPKAISHGPC